MPRIRTIRAIAMACLSLSAPYYAIAQQDTTTWNVGQEWRLFVRQYGHQHAVAFSDPRKNERKLVPGVQREFHVRARVTELACLDGRHCVRIKFTSEPDVPVVDSANPPEDDLLRGQDCTLTLDTQTWGAIELAYSAERVPATQVLEAEGYAAVFPQGIFPADWTAARSDFSGPGERTELLHCPRVHVIPDRPTPGRALRRTVSTQADGTIRITVGNFYLSPGQPAPEPGGEARNAVEQAWRPGELWWRSFRRFISGHIDLEAVLVSDPDGSGRAIEPPIPCPHEVSFPSGQPTWTIGQEWRFLVRQYSRQAFEKRAVDAEFHMKARVADLVEEKDRRCARIEFVAEDDAPGMYTALFTLVVDAQTWSPVRFDYPKRHGGVRAAAEAECYRALLPTMPGVPLDWVVLRSDLGRATAHEEFLHFPGLKSVPMFGLKRVISAPKEDGTLKVNVGLWVPTQDASDMTYHSAKDAMCEVEQIWHPGELWWRSFRRCEHGHLDLEATRISESE